MSMCFKIIARFEAKMQLMQLVFITYPQLDHFVNRRVCTSEVGVTKSQICLNDLILFLYCV